MLISSLVSPVGSVLINPNNVINMILPFCLAIDFYNDFINDRFRHADRKVPSLTVVAN